MAATDAHLPDCPMDSSCSGRRAAIEVKISSDMPLPMPRSVMSSPSHMTTAVPAIMTITMMRNIHQESSAITFSEQPENMRPVRASVRVVVAWRMPRKIVR